MKKPKKLSPVEELFNIWLNREYITPNEWSDAIEIEKEQSQKKENQFVLNMPFKIEPLTREVGTIYDGIKQTEVKNIGYVIKDAKGVEYFFYEKDGELVYDGWCAGFEQK